ncbi:hypothetical protein [Bacillus sp. FJAT-26390]|uniref:hypothetical protein n=1 Tax=Bacillus sp. FJAT-26390 TaxID=1743142 RepID=UPI000807DC75|nr:hypothetical protein [Bacillus sp. FJAT-26390]OBZ11384.1 hypothetical protein A7975_20840 [Bacillus sp. FJAT-26390]
MKSSKFFLSSVLCFTIVASSLTAVSAASNPNALTPETHPLLDNHIDNNKISYAAPLNSSKFGAFAVPPGEVWLDDFDFYGVTPNGAVQTDSVKSTGKNIQVNSQADAANYNQASGEYGITLYKKNWLGVGVSQGQINYPFGSKTVYVGTWRGVDTGTFYLGIKTISSTTSQKIDGSGKVYQNDAT